MNKVVDILMKRDGLSKDDAIDAYEDFREQVEAMMNEDASIFEIEDLFMDEFGLEPDYLEDILMEIVG